MLVHPEPVDDCYTCRVSGVQVAPTATPTRRGRGYDFQADFAREFVNGDREAYRRLRADGLQPPTIRGSAHLERHATTRFEVESGQIAEDPKALRAALDLCSDSGVNPTAPSLTEKVS